MLDLARVHLASQIAGVRLAELRHPEPCCLKAAGISLHPWEGSFRHA